jgi:hypothetical protein
VTEGDLSLFCAFVGYHVPLFIDEEYAKTTIYGGRIAPSSFHDVHLDRNDREPVPNHHDRPLSVNEGRFLAPVRRAIPSAPRSRCFRCVRHATYRGA